MFVNFLKKRMKLKGSLNPILKAISCDVYLFSEIFRLASSNNQLPKML
jgi:hypothetical protein